MSERFPLRSNSGRRRDLPKVDPQIRARFESLQLGQRPTGRTLPISPKPSVKPFSVERGTPERNRGARKYWVLPLFLLVVSVAVGVHGLATGRPLWAVHTFEVENNRIVDGSELLNQMGLRPGIPWWNALASVREFGPHVDARVASLDWQLTSRLGLSLVVQERMPVLRRVGRESLVVAADGILLALLAGKDPADLPLLTGPTASDEESGQRIVMETSPDWFDQLMKVRSEQPEFWATVSQIEFEEAHRFRLFFRDSQRVVLWDPYLNDHLWAQVPWVLEDLARRNVGTDAVLDMRFRDRIVVRLPEEEWYELRKVTEDADLGDSLELITEGGLS